jgi:peptidyl-prolyl cis-trans isomerase D
MATLEKLRNRGGTLIAIVIGLALVAFILGDFLGGNNSMFNNSDIEVAQISGKSIPYQQYQNKIDYLLDLNKALSGQASIDDQTTEQVKEEVWNDIVREHVLGKGIDELGLVISDDELFDMVQGNNVHPYVIQQFGNRQTGQFDKNVMISFLKNMDNDPSGLQKSFWMYFEELIKKDRITNKYNAMVRKGMFVTDFQSKSSLADRSRKVDFDFIVKRYSTIEDTTITVTEKEIKDYYKKHSSEFEQKESRDVDYIVFPIVPSTEDFQVAEKWINSIAPDFAKAGEAGQFVNLNSDVPFNPRFQSEKEITNPEMAKWAFEAKVGEMFGPIFDGDSYTLARLTDVANLSDSVKARHILISPKEQSPAGIEKAKATADSLLKVIKKGESFSRIASNFSNDPGSATKGGDLGWFPEGVMVKPFNDACFNGKKGDIAVVETQFGFHIIEVLDKSKPSKKVQLAVLDRKVVASTRTYQRIYSQASEFAGVNNTYDKINQAVQADRKIVKRSAPNLKPSDKKIAGLDNPREMIRWAFNAKKHEVSYVFEIGQNFVVATLTQVREEGIAPLEQVANDVKAKVIKDKKAEILMAELGAKKAKTNSIEELGIEVGVTLQNASRVSLSSFSIPAAGFEPVVIATAVQASEGQIVGPVKGNSGVYLLTVRAVNTEEGDEVGERNRILSGLQQRANFEPYEALKKRANIVDKRSKFF